MWQGASSLGGVPESREPLPKPTSLLASDAGLDRDALSRTRPGLLDELRTAADVRALHLRGDQFAAQWREDGLHLLLAEPAQIDPYTLDEDTIWLYLGVSGGSRFVAIMEPARAGEAEMASSEPDTEWLNLRQAASALTPLDSTLALGAVALANWHMRHRFCPMCGAPTAVVQAGWVRQCTKDGSQHFPRTDPAVIMSIIDADDRILLARGARWNNSARSVLAGFVEPGESFESAVARETLEESGVHVTDVEYVANQPWPFPASLMVAFTARATTTKLRAQEGEIEALAWYSRAELAEQVQSGQLRLPGRLSVSHTLIERWYGDELPERKDA